MIKVLVVDDSALVRKLLGQVFADAGEFETRFARDGVEALQALNDFAPDVVTLDVQMPQMDGLTCLDHIMIERPTPVVMFSSLTAEGAEATLEALALGAVDFIAKPGGAVSLRIHALAPEIVARVRAAAGARLRSSLRLRDRIRRRLGADAAPAIGNARGSETQDVAPAAGQGLVVVGVSTGGPPALETMLQALPATFAWPIVIAQHMPATFTGPLARRLDGLCAIQVVEVVKPVRLQAGCAYIGRGEADVVISRRQTGLVAMSVPAQADYPWHPSADRLVRSALDLLPARQIVGVLMTGMGNDGAIAMTKLHNDGGRTIAESEETAVVWGMPGELVNASGASYVEPLPQIAARLQSLTP